ncbi:MAG: protein kinase [Elusimicrobia bacterium]|nr:protein kinase [Elusimicrobiota bacterium]
MTKELSEEFEAAKTAKNLEGMATALKRFEGAVDDFSRAEAAFDKIPFHIVEPEGSLLGNSKWLVSRSIQEARDSIKTMRQDIDSVNMGPPALTGSSPSDKKQQSSETPSSLYQAAGQDLENLSPVVGEHGPEVLKSAGEMYLGAKKPKEAERVLRLSTGQKPDDAESHAFLATALAGQGRNEEALASAKKSLAIDANEPRALALVAHLRSALPASGSKFDLNRVGFGAAGQPPSGRSVDERNPSISAVAKTEAGTAAPTSSPAEKMMHQALRKAELGDLEAALINSSRAIAAAPKDARALALRAQISNKFKNHKAALADAEAALAISPDSVDALLEKSHALQQMGDYQGALEAADAAVRLAPSNALARLYRAQAAERLGRMPEALEDYRAAAQLDASFEPLYASARKRLGESGSSTSGLAAGSDAPGLKRWAMRLGVAGASTALILFGLTAARELTRRRSPAGADADPSPEPSTPRTAALPGLASQGTVPPGTVLGSNYRVAREVGRGGMGVVYEAFDQALERKVAVKQLRSELCGRPGERELFLREARLVAKLRHPNIVEIHAVIDEGELYLVFDYVEGKNLAEILAARGGFPLPEASRILKAACEAVGWAHGKGIVHRDLKPSNIMLADDGSVRVMDFGIARQSKDLSNPTLTSVAGTPQYMAPEQDFGAATRGSDLCSLGLTAYEITVGAFPFAMSDVRGSKLRGEFAPVSSKVPSLPPGLDGFFARALNPRPERRFADAASFLAAFLDAAA